MTDILLNDETFCETVNADNSKRIKLIAICEMASKKSWELAKKVSCAGMSEEQLELFGKALCVNLPVETYILMADSEVDPQKLRDIVEINGLAAGEK